MARLGEARLGWLLAAVLTAGCGPGTSSDGDGSTLGASSGGDASATSSGTVSADGSGSGGECPPNSVYAVPGCGDDPGVIPVPEAGCYEVCMDGDSSQCSEGSCINAWIDPCYDSPCEACGAEQWLCVAGDPLAPGFEGELQAIDGCGSSSFSVHAANPAGDVLLSVSVGGGLVETAQMTGMTQQQVFGLPAEEVTVRAWTGPQVASNACNDAPFGTILRAYEGVTGTVDVTFEPSAVGGDGTATVVLTDVVLQQTSGAGETVTIPSFAFEAISIWCCPG